MLASVTAGRPGRALAAGLLALALSACGLKDDLYLPAEAERPAAEEPDEDENSDGENGQDS